MVSKLSIEDETIKKQGISIEPQGIFTGTLDSWIVGTAVGADSSISAEAGIGIKSVAGKSALNNSLQLTSSFYITPSKYRKVRMITVVTTENVNFTTPNCDFDIGLFNSDNSSFIQVLFHELEIRTRVAGSEKTPRPTMKPTDPTKPKTLEIVWDTVSNFIDVFENHIFIYRFTGADLPDKNLSYQYKQLILTTDTLSDKIVRNRKLAIELEM